MRRVLLSVGILLLAQPATAEFFGGSSSGGGELLGDSLNPWFLTASQNVSYCVDRSDDFGVDTETLQGLVAQSFTYWDGEFSNAYVPDNLYGGDPAHPLRFHVKTNGFRLVDCSDQVDLVFEFGRLTPAQAQYVAAHAIDTRRYIAFSGRQDYDQKALRGKGFIYISPDHGPLAFTGDNVVENAWTVDPDHLRLGRVLKHELGHVFGLPHMGAPGSLMSQDFPELTVSKSVPIDSLLQGYLPVFYPQPRDHMGRCLSADDMKTYQRMYRFFAIDPTMPCVSVTFDQETLRVRARPAEDLPWVDVGHATFTTRGQRRFVRAVSLWLTDQQSVLPAIASAIKVLMGPSVTQLQLTGTFLTTNGQAARPIFVQDDPHYFQVGGVIDGEMMPDVLAPTGLTGIPMLPLSPSGWVDAPPMSRNQR